MLTDLFVAVCYVNVRDVAMVHVAAILDPEIKGERLFCWSKPITLNDILATLRRMYPSHQFIDDLPDQERPRITKDDSLILSLLKKWADRDDWISLEETIRDGMEEVV
jgi:nucleoside-diphosphate-sugar epimerase